MFDKNQNCILRSSLNYLRNIRLQYLRLFLKFASNHSVLELEFCSMTHTLRLKGEIGDITERRQCQNGDSGWCHGIEDRNKSKRSWRRACKARQCAVISTFYCVSEVVLSSVFPKTVFHTACWCHTIIQWCHEETSSNPGCVTYWISLLIMVCMFLVLSSCTGLLL
jgi:hypothetical protein